MNSAATRHHTLSLAMLVIAFTPLCAPAIAADHATVGHGLHEISNLELSTMRGRYTLGPENVAWFGVSMISTWQTSADQLLQSTLSLNMDFSNGQPQVTFQPNVTITSIHAPLPPSTLPIDGPSRSINSSGLANVGGVVQSVQVAGDGNLASNTTRLNVQNGGTPPVSNNGSTIANTVATISKGGATATASYADNAANVVLTIQGQGAVEQWIGNGHLGQSIALTSDNQMVSNQLQIELIRQAVTSNTQLAQNVAQAINLTHGVNGR
ncbi:hypothetical protein [Dyella silvatica]|uniref:hypothetical protein n=1 Tax=Dyella silvatica TaxID=2992128 RepID=UPI00225818FD|nr:hypothetical protein [Dyella silvatica]